MRRHLLTFHQLLRPSAQSEIYVKYAYFNRSKQACNCISAALVKVCMCLDLQGCWVLFTQLHE